MVKWQAQKREGRGEDIPFCSFFSPLPLYRSLPGNKPGMPVVPKRQNGGHQSDTDVNLGKGNSPDSFSSSAIWFGFH